MNTIERVIGKLVDIITYVGDDRSKRAIIAIGGNYSTNTPSLKVHHSSYREKGS